jgi:hypothetical protein
MRDSESDRRDFLKSCGRFAATVPPTMTVMLSTSLTSSAIAKSTGARDVGGSQGGGQGGISLGHGDSGPGLGAIIHGDRGSKGNG